MTPLRKAAIPEAGRSAQKGQDIGTRSSCRLSGKVSPRCFLMEYDDYDAQNMTQFTGDGLLRGQGQLQRWQQRRGVL